MTLLVLLLGMAAGLAWFLPDDKVREANTENYFDAESETPNE